MAAALLLVVHILCIYYARTCRSMLVVATNTLSLPSPWCAHVYYICSVSVSISCSSAYLSTASAHTSKLPPRGSGVLNMTTQHSQPQATSDDQSNGSSNTSASLVKLINGQWCSCNIATVRLRIALLLLLHACCSR